MLMNKFMKDRIMLFLVSTGVVFFAVILYPLVAIICIFMPLRLRGLIIKVTDTLRLLKFLDQISKN